MAPDPQADLDAVVREHSRRLAAAGVPSPMTDAVALAGHVLGEDAGEIRRLMVLRRPLPGDAAQRLEGLVAQRCARVPLQHLTGRAPFRGLELAVGPGVFVPRPETELAIDLALARLARLAEHAENAAQVGGPKEAEEAQGEVLAGGEGPVVVDLCTGSGAVALAVLVEGAAQARARAARAPRVIAVELSPQAHAWAQRNAETVRREAGLALDLRLEDARTALPGLEGQVDLVVSNPPYIPDGMVPVDPEVRDHDPALALYGQSADGLAVPLAVADRAAALLRPGGHLVMEHADTQGTALVAALEARGWAQAVDHEDASGRPRCVTARRPAIPSPADETLTAHSTKEDA